MWCSGWTNIYICKWACILYAADYHFKSELKMKFKSFWHFYSWFNATFCYILPNLFKKIVIVWSKPELHFFKLVLKISLVGRMFVSGPGDLGSIPGHVIPKTLKMVLDTSLLNTQQYKVHIKGKVEQSRERSSTPPHLGVVVIEKRAFWSLSLLYLLKI